MISERKLNRTNNRALVFVGEEIASATNRIKDSTRWDKVHVYKSTSGRYIVGIAQITYWAAREITTSPNLSELWMKP
jgi:hypothetical protein